MGGPSRTELDSHANMCVVGRNAFIVNGTGNQVNMNPFTPYYTAMTVDIVDAVVKYDCPYTGTAYLLSIFNALHAQCAWFHS